MLNYVLRRLLYSVLVLWGVATVVFLLFHALPGSTARLTKDKRGDRVALQDRRKALHLNQPLLNRYGLYLNELSPIGVTSRRKAAKAPAGIRIVKVSDSSCLSLKAPYLGRSFGNNRNVGNVLGVALPRTVGLVLTALLFVLAVGVMLGVLAAVKEGSYWDKGIIATTILGLSIPTFFAALLLAWASASLNSNLMLPEAAAASKSSVSPPLLLMALALAIRPIALIARLTRTVLLDIMQQDYIRTAYAKGLRDSRALLHHAMPNVWPRLALALPPLMVELLAGALFVEYIFGWNGIARITVNAMGRHDLPLVMGAILFFAVVLIVGQLLSELLYMLLDPRARLSKASGAN